MEIRLENRLMVNFSKRFKFNFDGLEKDVLCEVIDKKFWYRMDQETFSIDISELDSSYESTSRIKINLKPIHLIKAPMPGRITKIFVKEGESIVKSQPLLVMEAMKMEYTLKADVDTVIEKIHAQVGEQVILDYLLMTLKPVSISSK